MPKYQRKNPYVMPKNYPNIDILPEKPIVVLICNKKERELIETVLRKNYEVSFQTNYEKIQHAFRSKHIGAIVSCVTEVDCSVFKLKNMICEQFPAIPKIAIICNSGNIELIRKCGEIGIDRVILQTELIELSNAIHDLSTRKRRNVTLSDLCIEIEGLPEVVQKALLFIESHYLTIRFIEDIANRLEVSYSLLACEVQKSPICNLKKILLQFKIRHSLYLLQDNFLTIQEISTLSGFSEEKRYREGLKRLFGKKPTECQCELLSTTVEEYWNSNIPATTIPAVNC